MRVALQFVADAGAGNVVPKGVFDGLRFEATDLDWTHGTGRSISGHADAVLVAMAGRPAALELLDGEGVAALAGRIS